MVLFPYRAHLEHEIEYLQTQLAQSKRRVDELQEAIVNIAKPAQKVYFERKSDGKLVKVQPKGWEEVKRYRRENPEEALEPEAKGPYDLAEKEKDAKSK
jgi:formiminotetrahydrofolate cyclodeaminase